MEAGHGLTDGEFVKEFSTIDIFKNYRFREESMRRTTSVYFATHTESDLDDQRYRGNSPTYVRPIRGILKNEFNEHQSANCGQADKYDHTRRIPHLDRYNGRDRRNDS